MLPGGLLKGIAIFYFGLLCYITRNKFPFRRIYMSCKKIILILLAVASTWACAQRPVNSRLERFDPADARFALKQRANNSDDMLVILAFSGGGTRAASLSYGVMEELARTEVVIKGKKRRLIDEVDVISAVSGGSFPAAYYALYGERLFTEFEGKFLKKNIERGLIGMLFNPVNLFRLASPGFSVSDLASEFYDEHIFSGATFGDLHGKGAPMTIINATDVSTGARFTFTQGQFDIICADFGRFPVSRAVAASSAYPPVLSPITLHNYAGSCGYMENEWMKKIDRDKTDISGRALLRVRELRSFQEGVNRPYLHLFDGGMSDNLGLRGILEFLDGLEHGGKAYAASILKNVKKIIIIVVNARQSLEMDWDHRESPPGGSVLMDRAMGIPMGRYSYETIEALKDKIEKMQIGKSPGSKESNDNVPRLDFHFIEVKFESIPDRQERRYFLNLPTSFNLPADAVNRLRRMGARLLREAPEFRNMLKGLR